MPKSRTREYLDKDREMILWLFDSRCILCGCLANDVHEIIPISRGKSSLLIKNRVVLCRTHHSYAHDIGTNISIPILQEKRRVFLIRKFGLDEQLQKEKEIQEDAPDL